MNRRLPWIIPAIAGTISAMTCPGCNILTECGEDVCLAGWFCKSEIGSCGTTTGGTCTKQPEACAAIYAPVCGCDGETYSNPCMADASGVSVDFAGECSTSCCDPLVQPGVGEVPICVEGATCCADGQWRCNEGDGSNTCADSGICP